MPVVADGPMSIPLAGVAELIAACLTFQSATGTSNETEALAHTFAPDVPLYDEDNLPPVDKAIITDSDECQWEMSKETGSAGSLLVTFTFAPHPDYHPESPDALRFFTNTVGNICLEVLQRSRTKKLDGNPHWNAVKFTRLIAPSLCDERKRATPDETAALYFEITLLVDWL